MLQPAAVLHQVKMIADDAFLVAGALKRLPAVAQIRRREPRRRCKAGIS
jgi:hypothetical protein